MGPAARVSLLSFLVLASMPSACSKDPEPACTKDRDCPSTACTRGLCRDGECRTEALPDNALVADQTPVKDKWCTELRCKAGKPTEVALPSKTPEPIVCKKHTCKGTTLETENILDGVACGPGASGACRDGVCVTNPDSGPTDTGGGDTGSGDAGDDAASD